MASYYQRILRGAQSQWPAGVSGRDEANWNAIMDGLMTTGSAVSGGYTFTLADGRATLGGSSLTGWFKADALALANNDPVSTWTDSTGRGNNATQAGAARPVYKTNVQNSLPGVLFTAASSQYFAANGLASLQSGTDLPLTVIAVVKQATVAAIQRFCSWGRTASANGYMGLGSDATPNYQVARTDDAGTFIQRVGGTPDTSAHVVTMTFTGTAVSVWTDGTVRINNQALDVGAQTCDRFSIGCFGRSTNANFLDGHLFELLVYSAALSTGDRQAVERSLGTRWGITVA